MNKTNKVLLGVAIVLTVLTVSIWGLAYLQQSQEVDDNITNQVDTFSDVTLESVFSQDYNLTFESDATNLPSGESTNLNIVLEGSMEGISATEMYVKYDPEVIRVNSIESGNLFDQYVGEMIDDEIGLVSLAGALFEEKQAVEGTFATLNVTRIGEGETRISIRQFDGTGDGHSTLVTFDGGTLSLSERFMLIR